MDTYFFPYQRRWLEDRSPVKIWEKSRRIGATYVQAYEDVEDIVAGRVPAVFFSSADESAAKEYILYCSMWARYLQVGAEMLDAVVIDSDRDIKATGIQFANGRRIIALSSNPKGFRSKGGKVVLDEFGWHDDQDAMYKAARPAITWGFPMRILSTHNGQQCRYFKLLDAAKKGTLKWGVHTTPIQLAVEEGLADKISGRALTAQEREQWLVDLRADCADEETWLQEYCCVAVDQNTAFIPYDLIYACESADTLVEFDQLAGRELYLGMDIGRHRDLTVIWLIERIGEVLFTRHVRVLEKTPFPAQREILYRYLDLPGLRRACIDATGIGNQLSEEAQLRYGSSRIEQVVFTGPVKEDLAYGVRNRMDDRLFWIPGEFEIREDFHALRKTTTSAGNVRFDSVRSVALGHSDRFWSAALAVHAASNNTSAPVHIITARRQSIITGY